MHSCTDSVYWYQKIFHSIMVYYRWNFAGNQVIENTFVESMKIKSKIKSFSLGKGIIILLEDGHWGWSEVTKRLDNKLRGRQRCLSPPVYVCCDIGNRYYIQFADGTQEWRASRSFTRALDRATFKVSNVAFASRGGWFILFVDGSFSWNSLPKSLHQVLERTQSQSTPNKRIHRLSVSPDGHWFISYCDGTWDANVSQLCQREIDSLLKEHPDVWIENVVLGKQGMYCIVYDIVTKISGLSPWQIRFSKNSISSHFSKNDCLWSTISDLEQHILDPEDFPPIRVVQQNNNWVSLDNRRLFLFQNARIVSIPVIILDKYVDEIESYTSVSVLPCKCEKCCKFLKVQPSKHIDSFRSSCWQLFLEAEVPPSVLLLQSTEILPWAFKKSFLTKKIIKESFNKKDKSPFPMKFPTKQMPLSHKSCNTIASEITDPFSRLKSLLIPVRRMNKVKVRDSTLSFLLIQLGH